MTLKLSSKLSDLFDDEEEEEEVVVQKVVRVKETRRLEIGPVDEKVNGTEDVKRLPVYLLTVVSFIYLIHCEGLH